MIEMPLGSIGAIEMPLGSIGAADPAAGLLQQRLRADRVGVAER